MLEEIKNQFINYGKYKNKTYNEIMIKPILKLCILHKINAYNFKKIYQYLTQEKIKNSDEVIKLLQKKMNN